MEVQTEKIYKSKQTVREAMKRYRLNIKENDKEKYMEKLKFHRAYNKEYYKKMKEDIAKLHELLGKLEVEDKK